METSGPKSVKRGTSTAKWCARCNRAIPVTDWSDHSRGHDRYCSAAPTESPSGRYGLSRLFGMGVMTYARQKSRLDPVYIPLVRRARQLTRKIMPYAVINGSFDVIKSLALNINPQFTEEQVSLVIAGAFTAMGEIRRLLGANLCPCITGHCPELETYQSLPTPLREMEQISSPRFITKAVYLKS